MTSGSTYDRGHDAAWLATDAVGQVALLEAGEKGAIPVTEPPLESLDYPRLLELLKGPLESGSVPFQIDDLLAEPATDPLAVLKPSPAVALIGQLFLSGEDIRSGLVLFRAGFVVASLGLKRAIVIPVREGQLAVLDFASGLAWGDYQSLVQKGDILRVWSREGRKVSLFPEPWRMGIYHYVHENYDMPAAYERRGMPTVPLRADQVSGGLGGPGAAVRFEGLQFDEKPGLQPLEHFPRCDTRGSDEWLASDGRTVRL